MLIIRVEWMEGFIRTPFIDPRGTLAPLVFAAASGEMSAERELFVSIWAQREEGGFCQRREALVVLDEPRMQRKRPEQRISAKIIRKDMWG